MTSTIPLKIYKYQSLAPGTHTLENLKASRIWFAKPGLLNDPFDCAIPFTTTQGTDKDYQELYIMLADMLAEPDRLEKINAFEGEYLTGGQPNTAFRAHVKKVQQIENLKKSKNSSGWGWPVSRKGGIAS